MTAESQSCAATLLSAIQSSLSLSRSTLPRSLLACFAAVQMVASGT